MQSLKKTWAAYKAGPLNVRSEIIKECGKSIAWFYDALANPSKLSPSEKAVFEKHINTPIEWPQEKNLPE